MDEKNWLIQLQTNDAAAWKYLIEIYSPVLNRICRKFIANQAEAHDIVTDVFIRLWEDKNRFTNIQHIKNHLYVSTRNSCLNLLRSKQREEERHRFFTNSLLNNDSLFEDEIVYAELLADIRKEINVFPTRMREVFILAYFKKMSNEEIASQLQLSNQTVRNQKASALSLLRKSVGPKYAVPSLLLVLNCLHNGQ